MLAVTSKSLFSLETVVILVILTAIAFKKIHHKKRLLPASFFGRRRSQALGCKLVRRHIRGFTLVELLVVIAIIVLLSFLAVPAIQSLGKAGGFTKAVYDMADSLNLARSYAMAQNTYVYVGLTEVDVTQLPTASPQVSGNGGRVVLAAVATNDGTNGMNGAPLSATTWSADYTPNSGPNKTPGGNLTLVRQAQAFDFLHIATVAFPAGTGTMDRPTPSTAVLPTQAGAVGSFSLPLGTALGGGKYNFYTSTPSATITYNPHGSVLDASGNPVQRLEIDLQPMSGTAVPLAPGNVNQGNLAAIVIDGTTGAITVYRP
jgi:prepilin-type N-terminal cleavage/methylation domain-containing protein